MKIESIEAIAIDIPLKRNFGGSTYSVLKRSTVITRARTDEGLVSEVYNGDNREHGREIVRLIHEQLAPRVKGMDILEVERAWQAMFDLTPHERRPQDAARGDRVRGLRAMGPGRQGARQERPRPPRRRPRPAADHLHRRLLHGRQDARRFRARNGAVPRRRHGGLQVQGRRALPGSGFQAGRSRAQGGGTGLLPGGGCQPRLERCRTRSVSRA